MAAAMTTYSRRQSVRDLLEHGAMKRRTLGIKVAKNMNCSFWQAQDTIGKLLRMGEIADCGDDHICLVLHTRKDATDRVSQRFELQAAWDRLPIVLPVRQGHVIAGWAQSGSPVSEEEA
jgi:hypothetical protein